MYAQSVGPAKAGMVVNPPNTKALPITLNAPIKAPPIAAPRQPAINGVLNFTPRP